MTKKVWTTGELIPKVELDRLLQDLIGEALIFGVATEIADYVITDIDGRAIIAANAAGAAVEVTLPAATGSGRVIFMVCSDDFNLVTMVPAGADVIADAINPVGVLYTFTIWQVACVVDIAAGQWATMFATAALT